MRNLSNGFTSKMGFKSHISLTHFHYSVNLLVRISDLIRILMDKYQNSLNISSSNLLSAFLLCATNVDFTKPNFLARSSELILFGKS